MWGFFSVFLQKKQKKNKYTRHLILNNCVFKSCNTGLAILEQSTFDLHTLKYDEKTDEKEPNYLQLVEKLLRFYF